MGNGRQFRFFVFRETSIYGHSMCMKKQFVYFHQILLQVFIISPISFCLQFTRLKTSKLREIDFLV